MLGYGGTHRPTRAELGAFRLSLVVQDMLDLLALA
jgi:hypothetical protein